MHLKLWELTPFNYLAVPRIVAGTIALPMLSAIFLFIGNVGSYLVGTNSLMIDEAVYFF